MGDLCDTSATERTAVSISAAPREIHDLVYRCCRVGGMDPGSADEVAATWTEAAAADDAGESAVLVLRSVFDQLTASAHGFLVSEEVLDQLADDGPSGER